MGAGLLLGPLLLMGRAETAGGKKEALCNLPPVDILGARFELPQCSYAAFLEHPRTHHAQKDREKRPAPSL